MKTKERILWVSLELFSQNGYDGTSMQMIADAMELTKGAFYRHYTSKQDIFDHIVLRMKEAAAERISITDLSSQSFDDLKNYILDQFRFWTEDPFASMFRRLLIIDQFRNPEMGALYQNWFGNMPLGGLEDLFRDMMAGELLRPTDPAALALTLWAQFHFLLTRYDNLSDKETVSSELVTVIESFITTYK